MIRLPRALLEEIGSSAPGHSGIYHAVRLVDDRLNLEIQDVQRDGYRGEITENWNGSRTKNEGLNTILRNNASNANDRPRKSTRMSR